MRVKKGLMYGLGFLGLTAALLAGSTFTLLGSETARLATVRWVQSQSAASDILQLQGLKWPKLGHLFLESLTVYQNQTPWLVIKGLDLSWSPKALWQQTLDVQTITVEQLDYHVLKRESTPQPDEPSSLPTAPPQFWPIHIGELHLGRAQVHGLKTTHAVPAFTLQGQAKLFAHETPLSLHLKAATLADLPTKLNLETRIPQPASIHLRGTLTEPADGFVSNLLHLPKNQALDATFGSLLQLSEDTWGFQLETLTLPYFEHQLDAQGSATWHWAQQQLTIPECILRINDNIQKIKGSVSPQDIWWEAKLSAFPLDMANPWLKNSLAGFVNGQSDGHWVYAKQRLPNATFALDGQVTFQEYVLNPSIMGELKNNLITLTQGSLKLDQSHINAEGTIDPFGDNNRFSIIAQSLHLEPLRAWLPQWPDTFTGFLDTLNLNVSGALTDPKIQANLDGQSQFEGFHFAHTVAGTFTRDNAVFKKLLVSSPPHQLSAKGAVDWQKRSVDLQWDIPHLDNQLVFPLLNVFNITPPKAVTFQLNGEGAVVGHWKNPAVTSSLQVAGTYAIENDHLPYQLTLNGEAQFQSLANYQLAVETAQLDINNAQVMQLQGSAREDFADVTLQIDRLPTRLFKALGWHYDLGDANGTLNLKGTPNAPLLSGQLNYRLIEEALEVDITLDTKAGDLLQRFQFKKDDSPVGDFQLSLPFHRYLNQVNFSDPIPLAGEGQGNIELAFVQSLLNTDIHQLGGSLQTQFTLSGTLAKPQVNGYLKSQDIRYQNFITNTRLDPIQIEVTSDSNAITIERLLANDGDGGTLSAEGRIQLTQAERLSERMIELVVNADNLAVASTQALNGRVHGEVEVHGNLQDIWVTGNANVSPLNVSLEQAFQSSIPTLNYTEVGSAQENDSKLPTVHFKLDLQAQQQAFVRGRGLETEIEGDMTLEGTQETLSYRGRFDTRRGRFDAFGKRFIVEDGTVQISNQVVSLNVTAKYTGKSYDYYVEITGTQNAPKITLRSVPSMPDDEILSRLIFGKSVHDISPFQAIQLASAVNTLANGSTFDPIESTRHLLGVDTLTIDNETSDTGKGISLGVGKYVSEQVYVEVKHTPNPNQPWQGRMEIELTPNISVQSATSDTGGAQGEILWKMDY